jgi:hypothetical protein
MQEYRTREVLTTMSVPELKVMWFAGTREVYTEKAGMIEAMYAAKAAHTALVQFVMKTIRMEMS